MANIGTISAKIVADASAFLKGMNDVKKSAVDGVGSVRKTFLGDNVLSRFAGDAKGALSAIPFIGGAVGGIPTSGSAFIDWIKEGLKEVKEMNVEAGKMNITFDEFAALSRINSGDVEGFASGIAKMRKNLGAVQGETSEAGSAFHKLGMDVGELKGMGTIEQFGAIADQLNALTNQTDRAYFASKIFGKGYVAMSEALSKGSAGIAEAIDKNKGIMGSISPQDAANAKAALRTIKDIEDSVTGLKRQLAVEAAPFITQLAKGFFDLTKNGVDFRGIFQEILRAAAGFLADILDGVKELKDAVTDLGVTAKDVGALFSWKAGWDLKTGKWGDGREVATRSGPGSPSKSAADALRQFALGGKLPQAPLPKKLGGEFAPLTEEEQALQDAAFNLTKQIEKQASTIGMTTDQVQRWELAQMGATEAVLADVKAMQNWNNALKLNHEARSPLINFWKEVDAVLTNVDLTASGAALGIEKAVNAIGGFAKLAETKLPEIATAGSKEAFRIIAQADRPEKNIEDLLRQIASDANIAAGVRRQMLDELKKKPELRDIK